MLGSNLDLEGSSNSGAMLARPLLETMMSVNMREKQYYLVLKTVDEATQTDDHPHVSRPATVNVDDDHHIINAANTTATMPLQSDDDGSERSTNGAIENANGDLIRALELKIIGKSYLRVNRVWGLLRLFIHR